MLLAIAAEVRTRDADRGCRTVSMPYERLGRLSRVKPATASRDLRRLASGPLALDVRVPIGKDRHGEPLYAVPGRSPRFRVPLFEVPADCGCSVCRSHRAAR